MKRKTFLLSAAVIFLSAPLIGCNNSVAVTSITLTSASDEVQVNRELKIEAKVAPDNATDKTITWSSSDTSVVSVTDGLVKGLKVGSATIEALAHDGKGAKASKTIKVVPFVPVRVKSIQILGNSDAEVGVPQTYTVKVLPENADNKEVTWSSSDTSILTINENGVVTGLIEGSCTITAVSKDGGAVSDSKTINIKMPTGKVVVHAFSKPENQDVYERNTSSENQSLISTIKNIDSAHSGDPLYYNNNFFYYGDNEESKFVDNYKVGSQSYFHYQGATSWIGDDLIEHWNYNPFQEYTLYVKDGDNFTPIDKEHVNLYLENVDDHCSDFKFRDEKVGSTFKLEIRPSKEHFDYDEPFAYSLIFDLVKGYNVYDFADLTTFDNLTTEKATQYAKDHGKDTTNIEGAWDTYKEDHNIPLDSFDGVILHSDITLDSSEFPDSIIWTENEVNRFIDSHRDEWNNFVSAKHQIDERYNEQTCKELFIGSLKDRVNVFGRYINKDETFNFEGNYFNIDASQVKTTVHYEDKTLGNYQKADGSHAQLFGLSGDSFMYHKDYMVSDDLGPSYFKFDTYRPVQPDYSEGTFHFKNVRMFGNGNRSANDDLGAGGLIAIKARAKAAYITNVVQSGFFTCFLSPMLDDNTIDQTNIIDRCRFKDSYNVMFYYWGSFNNKAVNRITNSYCKNAGASVVLLDEPFDVDGQVASNHKPVKVVTENTYFESFVTGFEQWFMTKGGGAAGSLIQTLAKAAGGDSENDFYHKYKDQKYTETCGHKTFGKKDEDGLKINLVALLVNGGHVFDNTFEGGALESSFLVEEGSLQKPICDLGKIKADPTNIINTYKALADSQEEGQLFALQSSLGGDLMFSNTDLTNALMYDNKLIEQEIAENGFIDIESYIANQNAIDSKTPVCKNNFGDFFSGDYCSLYLEPLAKGNLIGGVLSYK